MPPAVVATPPPIIASATSMISTGSKVTSPEGRNSEASPVVVMNDRLVKNAPQISSRPAPRPSTYRAPCPMRTSAATRTKPAATRSSGSSVMRHLRARAKTVENVERDRANSITNAKITSPDTPPTPACPGISIPNVAIVAMARKIA